MNTETITHPKSRAALLRDASLLLIPVNEMQIADVTNASQKATEARYMVYELMEKAGYTQGEIADFFKTTRANVNKALAKLDVWKDAYKDIAQTCQRLENLVLK